VTRRAALPGAAELFRTTVRHAEESAQPQTGNEAPPTSGSRPTTGRRKHDSKITVYVSGEELVRLEQARVELRAEHGIAVDRGRIVREAVAVLLADLDEHGADSVLVRRLRQESGQ
jgi:hypothetical protein